MHSASLLDRPGRGDVLDALNRLDRVEQSKDTTSDLRHALEKSRRSVD